MRSPRRISARRWTWRSSLGFAARKFHSILWIVTLSSIVTVVGFIFCIAPGIYLAVAVVVSFADGPSGPRAGFWTRFGAWFVDAFLVAIVGIVIRFALGPVGGGPISLVIGVGYYGYLEGSNSGQTIGKRALGIRVIDFNTGGPIGFGGAVIRYLARILSAIPCFLGFFWMLWDKERQTWHDKLATDVVVPVSRYPVSSWPN